mgnify:CR=1 FL=1
MLVEYSEKYSWAVPLMSQVHEYAEQLEADEAERKAEKKRLKKEKKRMKREATGSWVIYWIQ